MALVRLAALVLLALAAVCRTQKPPDIYDRCALAGEIQEAGLVGFKGYTLGDYVCLAYHISNYNTSLHDSQTEYGIYQINSEWWCDDGATPGRMNLCGMLCTDLLNRNLKDDLWCVKRIVQDPKGLAAWPAWEQKCQGKDLSQFTDKC